MFSLAFLISVGIALVNAQYHHQPAAAPVNPYQNAIVSSISQDAAGNFGYSTADGQSRQQVVAPDGSVRGRYSYVDATGRTVSVNYIADKFGYRAAGDNVPAHAQFVPPPQPSTPAPYTPPAVPSFNPAPVPSFPHSVPQVPAFPSPVPAPAPAFPSFPLPYQAQGGASPAVQPPHFRNPLAEQQLVSTITQHQQNDQRAQAAQLQQLDAITRQNPAFTPAAHYPYGRR
ncbi:hypothetical protein CHUAL_005213 [Chamberlinius hualienensis]